MNVSSFQRKIEACMRLLLDAVLPYHADHINSHNLQSIDIGFYPIKHKPNNKLLPTNKKLLIFDDGTHSYLVVNSSCY